MGFLQQTIQHQLSRRLGARVTFERLNVSVLGGSVEAQGMVIATGGDQRPLLTVRRMRAEIAVARALKKELVIRSLAVEAPVLSLVRRVDGTLNLPRPPGAADAPSLSTAELPTVDEEATVDENADVARAAWAFAAQKVLVVDGAIEYRDERRPGVRFAAERVLAELACADGGVDVTCIVESAGLRGDRPAELGPIKFAGRADGVPDLSRWRDARLTGQVHVGDDILRGDVRMPSLFPPDIQVEVNGTLHLPILLAFLPAEIASLFAATAQGRVELSAKAAFDGRQLRVAEVSTRATGLQLVRLAKPEAVP